MSNDERINNLINWLSWFTESAIIRMRHGGLKDYELDLLDMFKCVDVNAYNKAYNKAREKLEMEN